MVDGDLWLNGGSGVYRPGVADENVRYRGGGYGTGRRGVYLYCAGHRLRLGQADVGHLVGVGRPPDV
ncbi:hypothetical protein D3C71_1829050 [compost metagenome]